MDIIFPIILLSVVIIGVVIKILDSWKKWNKPVKTESSNDDPYAYWDGIKPPRGPGHGGGMS